MSRRSRIAALSLSLCACRVHGVPEPPPGRDPADPGAPTRAYEPAADLLQGPVFVAGEAPPPAHHHHGHGGGS